VIDGIRYIELKTGYELQRWGKYQLDRGKSEQEVQDHIARMWD